MTQSIAAFLKKRELGNDHCAKAESISQTDVQVVENECLPILTTSPLRRKLGILRGQINIATHHCKDEFIWKSVHMPSPAVQEKADKSVRVCVV